MLSGGGATSEPEDGCGTEGLTVIRREGQKPIYLDFSKILMTSALVTFFLFLAHLAERCHSPPPFECIKQ